MIRIRHPEGTATFPLAADSSLASLQNFIQEQSGIAPSEQELLTRSVSHLCPYFPSPFPIPSGLSDGLRPVKTGYPPKTLSLQGQSGDLLVSSPPLNLKRGEQIVVARRSGSASNPASRNSDAASASGSAPVQSSAGPSAASAPRAAPAVASLLSLASAAAPSAPPKGVDSVRDGQVSVRVAGGDGHLTLKVVPDDNSCLFNSVGFLFEQRLGSDVCRNLRKVVADAIRSNPEEYPDVVLGQPRESYISKILSPHTWGGAIELSILSNHFSVEIASIDVASGVVHKFGEDKGFENRGFVVYSGIHYDVLVLLPTPNSPAEFGTTLFPSMSALGSAALDEESDPIHQAAKQLCDELKKRRYYTDTATFTLKCKVCGQGVQGEKEAVQHAKQTGHGDFGEV
ncbi:ubiquitin-specific protease otu1 [Thecaphora frezii]